MGIFQGGDRQRESRSWLARAATCLARAVRPVRPTAASCRGGYRTGVCHRGESLGGPPAAVAGLVPARGSGSARLHVLGSPQRLGAEGSRMRRNWCRGRDSNPHGSPHAILSRARLPFRHPGRTGTTPWYHAAQRANNAPPPRVDATACGEPARAPRPLVPGPGRPGHAQGRGFHPSTSGPHRAPPQRRADPTWPTAAAPLPTQPPGPRSDHPPRQAWG